MILCSRKDLEDWRNTWVILVQYKESDNLHKNKNAFERKVTVYKQQISTHDKDTQTE
jgi:hypothetical protein